MSAPMCSCGASWTGRRVEHCPACHESFTTTRAGDMHRVGRHDVFTGPHRRRCLTPDEMLVRGMTLNQHNYWTRGGENPLKSMPGDDLETPQMQPVDTTTREAV